MHAISSRAPQRHGGEWIRFGGIKFFLDGALGSRTAWMRNPYENSADCGVRVLDEPVFRDAVQRAAAAGLSSTVHAIGDAAVTLAFDVLTTQDAQAGTLPNRIEHVQCCPPDRTGLRGARGSGLLHAAVSSDQRLASRRSALGSAR